MTNNKPISIKDIAKLANVSAATVSRVLNNKGKYSKETEMKIMEIVQRYDYVSNMAAKSLRESKSNTIGLIVPDISNSFFSMIALNIEQELSSYGYSIFICNTANDYNKEKAYFRSLNGKLVDGIICISGLQNMSGEINLRNIPIVCIDRFPNVTDIPVVTSDDYRGSYLATEHLIKNNCKRIVFITSYTGNYVSTNRTEGYLEALKHYNIPVDKNLILSYPGKTHSYIESEEVVTEFLESGHTCDGIFASNDRAALGALNAVKKFGLKVPENIQICGFDNSLYSQLPSPSITTVGRDTKELAVKACEILMKMLDGETLPQMHYQLPVNLIVRESTF